MNENFASHPIFAFRLTIAFRAITCLTFFLYAILVHAQLFVHSPTEEFRRAFQLCRSGASSGFIVVTTPTGALRGNKRFRITFSSELYGLTGYERHLSLELNSRSGTQWRLT